MHRPRRGHFRRGDFRTSSKKRSFYIRGAFLFVGLHVQTCGNLRLLVYWHLLSSVLVTSRLFYDYYYYCHPTICSVCPSQRVTIVETCHDPINQVTLCIFTFESRVVSAVLTKDVLFVLVGIEPGDFCYSGLFVCFVFDFCIACTRSHPSMDVVDRQLSVFGFQACYNCNYTRTTYFFFRLLSPNKKTI